MQTKTELVGEVAVNLLEFKATVVTPGGRIGNNRKLGSSRNGRNWVENTKPGGKGSLPEYIRIVRNGIMKNGKSESAATRLAVAAIRRWKDGRGNVSAKVRAAAAKAWAEWEAMKAKSGHKSDVAMIASMEYKGGSIAPKNTDTNDEN